MIAQISALTIKSAAVVALALTVTANGLIVAHAHHADESNFLVQQALPRSGQTEIDPHDPYAPVDLTGSYTLILSVDSNRDAGDGGQSAGDWDMPPMPNLPGQPY